MLLLSSCPFSCKSLWCFDLMTFHKLSCPFYKCCKICQWGQRSYCLLLSVWCLRSVGFENWTKELKKGTTVNKKTLFHQLVSPGSFTKSDVIYYFEPYVIVPYSVLVEVSVFRSSVYPLVRGIYGVDIQKIGKYGTMFCSILCRDLLHAVFLALGSRNFL